ncbi:hypothetical protein RFI_13271 [Reticulomyxa filosa]|uniref:Pterin-binding domain-containing protein n=1 Tax=Reticulomyxa filosa TaxID=46433 RepID=X6NC77_RETFI|nr:hypothetical protein RFI_13271 [Reticulomyxa filosa]|eukprot:ETO23890.1 hypothetical protein RFI_13271 [Reticulomyxa filosa]
MHERNFVMTPFSDILPDLIISPNHATQNGKKTTTKVLAENRTSTAVHVDKDKEVLHGIHNQGRQRTLLMAVVNVTPDSFSDGENLFYRYAMNPTNTSLKEEVETKLLKMKFDYGVDILDIGGQSSRPQSPMITAQEELRRVAPLVDLIRSHPQLQSMVLSLDTIHPDIAKFMHHNFNISIVNDISGGSGVDMAEQWSGAKDAPSGTSSTSMFQVMSELSIPYVLMHMRGTPKTMLDPVHMNYHNDICDEIKAYFDDKLQTCIHLQMKRWNIILDCGIGFAKDSTNNQILVARMNDCKPHPNMPMLCGPSQKRFLRQILDKSCTDKNELDKKDFLYRKWGTIAVLSKAVLSGANIIRIHDAEMMNVARCIIDSIQNEEYNYLAHKNGSQSSPEKKFST